MADKINPHILAIKTLSGMALLRSGVNRKTLADALDTSEGTISRKLSLEHPHEWGVTEFLMFETITGDRTVADYIERELGRKYVEEPAS